MSHSSFVSIRKLLLSLLLVCTMVGVSTPLFAQGVLNASETSYRDELNRIKLLPGSSVAADEIAQVESWIDKAAAASDEGDREVANRYYKRVRFALDMLVVKVDAERIKASVSEQRKFASEAPQKVIQLREEVAQLEAERIRLKNELAKLM